MSLGDPERERERLLEAIARARRALERAEAHTRARCPPGQGTVREDLLDAQAQVGRALDHAARVDVLALL